MGNCFEISQTDPFHLQDPIFKKILLFMFIPAFLQSIAGDGNWTDCNYPIDGGYHLSPDCRNKFLQEIHVKVTGRARKHSFSCL